MDYAKINKYKTPAIVGSFALASVVAAGSFFYGIKSAPATTQQNFAAQTEQQSSGVDLKIKGNRNSKIYHLRGCPNYDDLKEKNVIWFKTKEEATSAGYRMARNC